MGASSVCRQHLRPAGRSRSLSTRSDDKHASFARASMTRTPCVISVADHAGWAHMVCVSARENVPAVVERRRVTLIDAGLPTLPYHHESLALQEAEANALIARVRRSIASCASRAL